MPDQEVGMGIEIYEVYMASGKQRWARLFFDRLHWRLAVKDREEQTIVCNLGSAEVRVLYQLVSRSGQVFSKEQLILFGWPGRVVTVGSLTQAIFNIRSFFGADGHSVIVTSPKAGYMFNSDYLACALGGEIQLYEDAGEVIDTSKLVSLDSQNLSENIDKVGKGKKIVAYSLIVVGVFVLSISFVYLFKPELEILWGDPLKITSISTESLDFDFITSVKKDIASPLMDQIKKIPVGLHGEVMVRVHDRRYRVVCYTAVGASSYAVPINVPLNYAVERCISNAGVMSGGL